MERMRETKKTIKGSTEKGKRPVKRKSSNVSSSLKGTRRRPKRITAMKKTPSCPPSSSSSTVSSPEGALLGCAEKPAIDPLGPMEQNLTSGQRQESPSARRVPRSPPPSTSKKVVKGPSSPPKTDAMSSLITTRSMRSLSKDTTCSRKRSRSRSVTSSSVTSSAANPVDVRRRRKK